MNQIMITFNQQIRWVTSNYCLQRLLEEQTMPLVYAVAVNGKFVSKAQYAHYLLQAEDVVAVLTPMQGG